MTHVSAIATSLPCWGSARGRVAGGDEDVVTLAVEAGRAAIDAADGGDGASGDGARGGSAGGGGAGGGGGERVVIVSRELPLLEGGNAAVLLAGLGLDPEIEVSERLGGAPAALDALTSGPAPARGRGARAGTLRGARGAPCAGAAAAVVADSGLPVVPVARVARSLPVRTRSAAGEVHDYGDRR